MTKNRFTVVLLCLFLLSGCGSEEPEDQPGSTLETSQWLQGFKETTALAVEKPYYEIRRSNFQTSDIDFSYDEKKEITAYAWDARYVLTSVRTQGEERYFLNRQETDLTMEEPIEILTDWSDRPHGLVICMDAVTDDKISLLFAENTSDWQGDILGYHFVTVNPEGELLSVQDVTKVYQELGNEGYVPDLEAWWCDTQDYQYLLTGGTHLAVIDSQGRLSYEKEYDATVQETLTAAFHMPDGSLVFSKSILSESRTELVWTRIPEGKEHVLWECPGIGLNQFTITPEGILYYSNAGILWSWNIQTGEKERLFSFSGTGIAPGALFTGDTCYLTVGGEHELFLYAKEPAKIMALTDTVPENENDILCVKLWGGDLVRNCAASFSREHDGPMIRYESRAGWTFDEEEVQWTRLSAEIAAGKGPDIMVLGYDRMLSLQQIGALEPLDDYFEPDTLDALFTGVREAGYINGKLYGVMPAGRNVALLTSDEIWEGESWDLQDIFEIIEKKELEGLIADNPSSNLYYLSGLYLGRSPFYDAETGESNFESEDFIRLLEICKRFGKTGDRSRKDALELLIEGKLLAVQDIFITLNQYARTLSEYEDKIHYVCYPGQTDQVGVFNSSYFVVVNKNAKDKEVIGEFLNYLLSDETQMHIDVSYVAVNKRTVENNVWLSVDLAGERFWLYKTNEGNTAELPEKEDGTTYVSDYVEFLDHAEVQLNSRVDPIWQIIEEELESYWSGTKSAEEVAKIIDNRVQLYLDERN